MTQTSVETPAGIDTAAIRAAAKNLDDGTVEVIAQGRRADCESLLAALKSGDTAGHVEQVQAEMGEPEGRYKSFGIY